MQVMYVGGYATLLGSNVALASIWRTAQAQLCIEDYGFESKKNEVGFLPYPQAKSCKNNDVRIACLRKSF